MNSPTFALWLGRAIILAVTVLFTVIGLKFVLDPVHAAAGSGLSLASAVGYTNARAGIGGFPLGIAAILAFCLLSRRRHLMGLAFIVTVASVILAIRLYSVALDGTFAESLRIIAPEAAILAIALFTLRLERRLPPRSACETRR
jgi:hypothetical protein